MLAAEEKKAYMVTKMADGMAEEDQEETHIWYQKEMLDQEAEEEQQISGLIQMISQAGLWLQLVAQEPPIIAQEPPAAIYMDEK